MALNIENIDTLIKSASSNISGKKGADAIRARISYHTGSSGMEGIEQCLREIIENSIDESKVVANAYAHADKVSNEPPIQVPIDIDIHEDGSVCVRDYGRGIPCDLTSFGDERIPAIFLVFEEASAGGKGYVDDTNSGYNVCTTGIHGAGACITNAGSEYMEITNTTLESGKCHGHTYFIRYEKGKRCGKQEPNHGLNDLGIVKDSNGVIQYGCQIKFKIDNEVFNLYDKNGKHYDFPFRIDNIISLLKGYAYEIDNIVFNFSFNVGKCNDYPNGYSGRYTINSNEYKLTDNINSVVLGASCPIYTTILNGSDFSCKVACALTKLPYSYHSVNMLPLKESSHLDAFYNTLLDILQFRFARLNQQTVKGVKFIPDIRNLNVGVILQLSTRKAEFNGQIKSQLVMPKLANEIKGLFTNYFITNGSEFINQVFDMQFKNYQQRLNAYLERQRKLKEQSKVLKVYTSTSLKEQSELQSTLIYPSISNLRLCDLIIAEGSSAISSIKSILSPNQGVLGLSGKLINVRANSTDAIMKDEDYKRISLALSHEWGRVLIFTDADSDGGDIRVQLLSLFVTPYYIHYIEQNRVYIVRSPLYLVRYYARDANNSGNAQMSEVYFYNDKAKNEFVTKYNAYIVDIKRFKGNGSLSSSQLSALLRVNSLVEVNNNWQLVKLDNDIEQSYDSLNQYAGKNKKYRKAYVYDNYMTSRLQQYARNYSDSVINQRISLTNNHFTSQWSPSDYDYDTNNDDLNELQQYNILKTLYDYSCNYPNENN